MNLREGIQDIVRDKVRGSTIRVAEVVSVQDDGTCTVTLDSETEVAGVRLQADEAFGVYFEPAVGSTVFLARVSDFDFYVIGYSRVDLVSFGDGTFGGMVKVIELTQKLNNLENDINTLKQAFAAWVTVPNDGGAALKAIAATWFGASLTPTIQSEIENENLTHGDVGDL